LRFFTKQINPQSLGSWHIEGTEESTLEMDSSVPLTHHNPRNLGLICLIKKQKNPFSDSFGLNPILDFLKEMHPERSEYSKQQGLTLKTMFLNGR